MKIAFSATLISQILWATLFPFHIRAAEICPNFSTEETCISNSETREFFKSPCVWCCGNMCKGGKWKCEPLSFLTDYLESQVDLTNWDGKGMTRYGNACGPNSESLISSGPTTIFDGQNYTIQAPDVTFQDTDGQFKLEFLYKVGKSAEDLNFSLFRTGCENDSGVSNIITASTSSNNKDGEFFREVSVDKTKIQNSTLFVSEGESQGFSAGSINFCAKAETLAGSISVSFLKTDVSLKFDLTNNTFTVEKNGIQANAIGNETSTIDVNYDVDACRCSKDEFTCIPSDETIPVLTQNELVSICLSPNDASKVDVDISNFEMDFVQNKNVVYKAADFGTTEPLKGSLSQISTLGQTYKVTSRVVTEIFEGGTSFNVTGVAYLEFKSRRLLASVGKQGLRGIQGLDTSETETPFSLNLEIKKTKERAGNDMARGNLSVTFTAAVAAVVLALVFVIRKKLA